MESIVLAPLVPLALHRDAKGSGVPMVSASRCGELCGNTMPGFGSGCIYEEAGTHGHAAWDLVPPPTTTEETTHNKNHGF